jgi:phosphoribosylformylglycinamidine cyclo-ligase
MTSYRAAGVDLEGAERHVAAIAESVIATWGGRVIGGFGGFAAGIEIPPGYRNPVLMMATDGVGTKLDLARRAGRWDGVGFDLVAMCVDDLAAVGARPLGLVDYLAVGGLEPERDRAIVASIAAACVEAGCALLGGETAEHPGVMPAGAVDLAGAVVGVVEKGEELGPRRVTAGDVVVALASPNLRSNGFSLVRAVFGEELHDHLDRLLEPSVIYCPAVLDAVATGAVHAAAHVTGGGIAGNLERVLPDGLGAQVDTGSWAPPPPFDLVASRGVSREDMFGTFNMGVGFCLVVEADGVDAVMSTTAQHAPWRVGSVVTGAGVVMA